MKRKKVILESSAGGRPKRTEWVDVKPGETWTTPGKQTAGYATNPATKQRLIEEAYARRGMELTPAKRKALGFTPSPEEQQKAKKIQKIMKAPPELEAPPTIPTPKGSGGVFVGESGIRTEMTPEQAAIMENTPAAIEAARMKAGGTLLRDQPLIYQLAAELATSGLVFGAGVGSLGAVSELGAASKAAGALSRTESAAVRGEKAISEVKAARNSQKVFKAVEEGVTKSISTKTSLLKKATSALLKYGGGFAGAVLGYNVIIGHLNTIEGDVTKLGEDVEKIGRLATEGGPQGVEIANRMADNMLIEIKEAERAVQSSTIRGKYLKLMGRDVKTKREIRKQLHAIMGLKALLARLTANPQPENIMNLLAILSDVEGGDELLMDYIQELEKKK